MRSVSVRQFQRNLYEELKNLPVIVTREKKKKHPLPIFIVYPYAEGHPESLESLAITHPSDRIGQKGEEPKNRSFLSRFFTNR